MAVNIAVFGAFVLIVAVFVFVFFHWQTLFASEKYGYREEKAEPTYSQQAARSENASGTSASPSGSKKTDEAIAEYAKWLAIFTMFLVLATIGLFISGERNVDVARRAARCRKEIRRCRHRQYQVSARTVAGVVGNSGPTANS